MDIVHFKSSEEFSKAANALFAEEKQKLNAMFPSADIQHIGGTAVPGLLTKGDLDINIRVDGAQFNKIATALKEMYEINQPENWSDTYASFKDDTRDLGIQVTVVDSNHDFFTLHRDELCRRPELVRGLNALKAQFKAKNMDEYRKAKGEYLRQNIPFHYD